LAIAWTPVMILSIVLPLGLRPAQASPMQTRTDIGVVDNTASYRFGEEMIFSLEANSDTDITECYLFFRAANEERTNSVAFEFLPSPEIRVTYAHDLRASPLSPFAIITYWWQIRDRAGQALITEPQQLNYIDNRFEWETLNGDGISVHWIMGQGDPRFGQTALDIALASLPRINVELQASVPEATDIYIYDSQEHLSSAMMLADRDWITGQTHPELGVIVIAIPAQNGYGTQMMRDIPHEMTHLLIHQAVSPEGYRYVPEWLDEGLAVANEELPNSGRAVALEEAQTSGTLIPLSDLCIPFSPDPQTATLAYAQSGSIVKFIRERYGAEGIRSLLSSYAHGASCSAGVEQALGLSLRGLDMMWRASIAPSAKWKVWLDQGSFFIGLVGLGLLLAIPLMGLRRPRS